MNIGRVTVFSRETQMKLQYLYILFWGPTKLHQKGFAIDRQGRINQRVTE